MQTNPGLDLDGGGYSLLPDGNYHFKVMGAKDGVSKTSGNNHIELILAVSDPQRNAESLIYDYLVEKESMEWKTRHFCKATGLEEVYATGNLTSLDCLHTQGVCGVCTEKATRKFPAKNKVKDYMFEIESNPQVVAAGEPVSEDDIPF